MTAHNVILSKFDHVFSSLSQLIMSYNVWQVKIPRESHTEGDIPVNKLKRNEQKVLQKKVFFYIRGVRQLTWKIFPKLCTFSALFSANCAINKQCKLLQVIHLWFSARKRASQSSRRICRPVAELLLTIIHCAVLCRYSVERFMLPIDHHRLKKKKRICASWWKQSLCVVCQVFVGFIKSLDLSQALDGEKEKKPGIKLLVVPTGNAVALCLCFPYENSWSVYSVFLLSTCCLWLQLDPFVALNSIRWVKMKNVEAGWPTQPSRDVSAWRKVKVLVCTVLCIFD